MKKALNFFKSYYYSRVLYYMQKRMSKSTKTTFSVIAVFIVVLSIIAYLLADRFWIPHVQIDLRNTSAVFAPVTGENSAGNPETSSASAVLSILSAPPAATASNTSAAPVATSEPPAQTSAPQHTDVNGEPYTATATSYSSESTNIKINTVSTGTGKNKVTYFVADVQVADAMQIMSAFAKDEYGRNIVENVSDISERNNAIFSVNGDYYGFRTNGVVIRNGVLYRDKPAREGLALYKDGTVKVFDEKSVTSDQLLADGVWNTFSFGPGILENGVVPDGIDDVRVDSSRTIQGLQPRTGIGFISANHFIFVVVDGRDEGYSKGVTLKQFAQIFKDLGCSVAYNLDGGGSTEMWFMGNIINYPCNGDGNERATSDIIYIK